MFKVLKNVWKPQKCYDFPLLEHNKERSLKFQYAWLDKYSWLAYSKALNGGFCKYCVVFAGNTGGVGNQPLGNLVVSPFQQFKNAHRVNKKKNLYQNMIIYTYLYRL